MSGKRAEWEKIIQDNLPKWISWFQELIQTPSVFEDERAATDRVEDYLSRIGINALSVPHDPEVLSSLEAAQPPISQVPGRRSLAARLPGAGGGRSIILVSHLDVIPPGDAGQWSHPPFSGHIDPERNVIYGRGAMDDKAGVTLAIALLDILSRSEERLRGDVIFHFILEDETTGNGSLLCLKAGHKGDAALILDGTRSDVAIDRHSGQIRFRVVMRGKSAPFSVSHQGINAIELLSLLLLRMKEKFMSLNHSLESPWTELPNPIQFIIHSLHGEGAQASVPDEAHSECHVTFPPPYTLEDIRRLLLDSGEEFSREHSPPAAPEFLWCGIATEPTPVNSGDLKDALQKTASDLGWKPVKMVPSTGVSDLRHYVGEGIPCLLYGPGKGFNPHRPDEHYYLDDLGRMIMFYLEFLKRWSGTVCK